MEVDTAILGERPLELLLIRGAEELPEVHAQLAFAPELRRDRPVSRHARRCGHERGERTRLSLVQRVEAEHRGAVRRSGAQDRERFGGRVVPLAGQASDDRSSR
jgi:hypothetical protein